MSRPRKERKLLTAKAKITFSVDERTFSEPYVPPKESVRGFILSLKDTKCKVQDLAVKVICAFYLPKLELTYPLTVEELIRVAEQEDNKIRATEREEFWHYPLPREGRQKFSREPSLTARGKILKIHLLITS